MGTNYYAHIIPTEDKKEKLYKAVRNNKFHLIESLVSEMYGNIEFDFETQNIKGGIVHLGKGSCGWKFLWNPNVFVVRHGHYEDANGKREYIFDPDTPFYLYPLTKIGLYDFIFRKDVLIYDEYHELQNKEEFWDMALLWGQEDGWDAASYESHLRSKDRHDFYPVTGDLTNLLKSEGYQFTSLTNSDFYSDGLRFAGFTHFS